MSQVGRTVMRSTKNYIKGYSDIQIKVRQATCNDPWGASGALLNEIAESSYNTRDFVEVMEVLDKRLNDHGKNWRHVFKALTVVEFLLYFGSEQVITYTKENNYIIKTLKEFQYIDDEGKDQGRNIREKSKEIAALLADEARLREERAKGKTSPRMRQGFGSMPDEPPRLRSGSGGSRGALGSASSGSVSGGGGAYYAEDAELQRALAESRRTAQAEESRRNATTKEDRDLQAAIELSEREAIQRRMEARNQMQDQPTGGSGASSNFGANQDLIDIFGQSDAQAMEALNVQQMQQNQFLQAQIQQQQLEQQRQQAAQLEALQRQQQQQQQHQQQQQQMLLQQQNQFQGLNPFGIAPQQTGVSTNMTGVSSNMTGAGGITNPAIGAFPSAAPLQPQATGQTTNPFGMVTGGPMNPSIARNTNQIDPFASLANQRYQSTASGGPSHSNSMHNLAAQATGTTAAGGMSGFGGMGGLATHQTESVSQHNTGNGIYGASSLQPIQADLGFGGIQQNRTGGMGTHPTGMAANPPSMLQPMQPTGNGGNPFGMSQSRSAGSLLPMQATGQQQQQQQQQQNQPRNTDLFAGINFSHPDSAGNPNSDSAKPNTFAQQFASRAAGMGSNSALLAGLDPLSPHLTGSTPRGGGNDSAGIKSAFSGTSSATSPGSAGGAINPFANLGGLHTGPKPTLNQLTGTASSNSMGGMGMGMGGYQASSNPNNTSAYNAFSNLNPLASQSTGMSGMASGPGMASGMMGMNMTGLNMGMGGMPAQAGMPPGSNPQQANGGYGGMGQGPLF